MLYLQTHFLVGCSICRLIYLGGTVSADSVLVRCSICRLIFYLAAVRADSFSTGVAAIAD
jgi:hypothetical protein